MHTWSCSRHPGWYLFAVHTAPASSTTTPSLGMKIDEPTTAANPPTAAEKIVARSGQGSKSSTPAHENKPPAGAPVSSSSALEIARREQKKREYEGDADCKDLGDDKTVWECTTPPPPHLSCKIPNPSAALWHCSRDRFRNPKQYYITRMNLSCTVSLDAGVCIAAHAIQMRGRGVLRCHRQKSCATSGRSPSSWTRPSWPKKRIMNCKSILVLVWIALQIISSAWEMEFVMLIEIRKKICNA